MQMQHNAVGGGGTADESKDVHEKSETQVPVRAQQPVCVSLFSDVDTHTHTHLLAPVTLDI